MSTFATEGNVKGDRFGRQWVEVEIRVEREIDGRKFKGSRVVKVRVRSQLRKPRRVSLAHD